MAYTIMEQIRIQLDEYEVTIDVETNQTQVVFPSKPKLEVELQNLIDKAKSEVINYRRYPSDWSDEQIEADINDNYSHSVVDLVLYDYYTKGADYETSHNENGVSRSFINRDKILGKIIPFCNIF